MSAIVQLATKQNLLAPGGTQRVTQRKKKQAVRQKKNTPSVESRRREAVDANLFTVKETQAATPASAATGTPAIVVKSAEKVSEPFSKPSTDTEIKKETSNFLLESQIKRAGEYLLGPVQGTSPVKCITQYLARKENTDQFYVIKILTLKNAGEKETMDDIQGKTLIHTEHSLLSLLQNETGVVHEHGLFKDTAKETSADGTVKEVRRLCLVLDCFLNHDFSPKYNNITNVQYYVIKEKKLPEKEAIRIFMKVVQIVDKLHKLNIVHRDLKLGNFVLNKDTKDVTLANFCLGKHLQKEKEMLKDQRGSPAYISPDVINGKPYLGKPSDMWALGVSLYTMLYGQFPFYDHSPSELFRKIKLGEFQIPVDVNVSSETVELIKSLLTMDPEKRITATAALEKVKTIIAAEKAFLTDSDLQVVPDVPVSTDVFEGRPMKRSFCAEKFPVGIDNEFLDFANFLMKSSESDEYEPSRKLLKRAAGPGGSTSNIAKEGLEEFHAIYKACTMMMMKKAAELFSESGESGGFTSPFLSSPASPTSSTSSNFGFTKCATNIVEDDNESARVPSF